MDPPREVVGAGDPAQHDDPRGSLGTPAVLGRELIAAHATAQIEVDHDDVGVESELIGNLEGLLTGARDPDGELVAERLGDCRERVGVVLNNENADPTPLHGGDILRAGHASRAARQS